jgi:hypothetical protein
MDGFQWMAIKVPLSDSDEGDDETGPFMDRSNHSHGSITSYLFGTRQSPWSSDAHQDGNPHSNSYSSFEHNAVRQLVSSPRRSSWGRRRNGILSAEDDYSHRNRSRSESPTSTILGRNTSQQRNNSVGGLDKSGPDNDGSNLEYQLNNSRLVLIGSISAVINFLRSSGVPKPS